MKWHILLLIPLLVLLPVPTTGLLTVDFQFVDTSGDTRSIDEFSGELILLEWGASWCSVCKRNQEAISEIYDMYKDDVTFISISIKIGHDELSDVQDMQTSRGYEWIFGLETTEYSSDNGARNGYTWLIDENLQVIRTWNSTIVTASDLGAAFEEEFGLENLVEPSSVSFPFPAFILIMATIVTIRRYRRL